MVSKHLPTLLTPKETSRCLFSSNKSVCQERSSVLKQRRPEANRTCFTASVQPIKRNQRDVYYTASSLFIAQLAAASGDYLYLALALSNGFYQNGSSLVGTKKEKDKLLKFVLPVSYLLIQDFCPCSLPNLGLISSMYVIMSFPPLYCFSPMICCDIFGNLLPLSPPSVSQSTGQTSSVPLTGLYTL